MKFTEAQLEAAIIELLGEEGYPHVLGEAIDPPDGVPFLDTIYIDKPIQRHNLIQTISRVNRKFEGKEKGLVVDYIGIKKQMNLALAQYSKADGANIEEINESITVVKDHLDLLARFFHKFDSKPYFTGSPVAQLDCLNKATEFVQLTEKLEKRFMGLVKRLKAAYDILKELARKYDFDYPEGKLLELSKEVKKVVDDKARYPDWGKKDSIKAELKADLILLLAKYDYPPVDRDEVYKEIFEQAENFEKYQGD